MPLEAPILRFKGCLCVNWYSFPYQKKSTKKGRFLHRPIFVRYALYEGENRHALFFVYFCIIHFGKPRNRCQKRNDRSHKGNGKNVHPVYINDRLSHRQHGDCSLTKCLCASYKSAFQPHFKIVSHYKSFLCSSTSILAPWFATVVESSSICSPCFSMRLSWLS